MSEPPTAPDELVGQILHNEVRQYVTAEGDRAADVILDGNPKSLEPALEMAGNSTIGVRALKVAVSEDSILNDTDRASVRFWFSGDEERGADVIGSAIRCMRWFPHCVILTCIGNCDGIVHRASIHHKEALTFCNLLRGLCPRDRLEQERGEKSREVSHRAHNNHLVFRGIRPALPYWGVFEGEEGERVSLYPALASLPRDALGIYQVVIKAMQSDVATMIKLLLRGEELLSQRMPDQHRGWVFSDTRMRTAQQKVSEPLFSAAVRIAVAARDQHVAEGTLSSMMLPIARLRFSGKPLETFSELDLAACGVTADMILESLVDGTTYLPGLVVSPGEVGLLMPFPTEEEVRNKSYPLDRAPIVTSDPFKEDGGLVIGKESVFGETRNIVWPTSRRVLHMLVTGSSGFGKTVFLSALASTIANTRSGGIVLIDPHDKAIVELCCRLNEDRLDDAVLFDAGDREYVFCLPLMDCEDVEEIDVAVSNVTHQLFAMFQRSDMGFVIERGIRCAVRTVLLCPEMSFWDARHLHARTRIGERTRDLACAQIKDEVLLDYWQNEFRSLDAASLGRIRSRFDYILEPQRLRVLLANKIRKISYRDYADGRRIMLCRTNVSGAGADAANIVGTLKMTGVCSAASSRPGEEGKRSITTIIGDEFNNYSNPRTIPHSLRTLRRSDVSIVLATQNICALPEDVREAIGNIDTHVVFHQGWDDAQQYFRQFCGIVPAEELMSSEPGEGYVKIGRQLFVMTAGMSERLRGPEVLEEIRENTRRKYCIPLKEFKERMIEEHHVPLEDMKNLDLL